jgi:endonuclease-3
MVVIAPVEEITELIWVGGLARVKALRIKDILKAIWGKRGSLELDFLKDMPLPEAKAWLRELPGVGPKTAACVLLFSLGQPALPVDTHVCRVTRRLGLIDAKVSVEEAHEILEAMLSPVQVYPFHVYMVEHGRRTCVARRPRCPRCVLKEGCPSSAIYMPLLGEG